MSDNITNQQLELLNVYMTVASATEWATVAAQHGVWQHDMALIDRSGTYPVDATPKTNENDKFVDAVLAAPVDTLVLVIDSEEAHSVRRLKQRGVNLSRVIVAPFYPFIMAFYMVKHGFGDVLVAGPLAALRDQTNYKLKSGVSRWSLVVFLLFLKFSVCRSFARNSVTSRSTSAWRRCQQIRVFSVACSPTFRARRPVANASRMVRQCPADRKIRACCC